MKKTIILLTVAALVGIGSYVVFAQDPMGGGMMSGNMQGRGMMGGNMQGRSMMSGMQNRGMMGPMMRGSSLVATRDGGVVVLMGNELLKYDKDLNLSKKVEVKADWKKIQKTMMEHRNMMTSGQSNSE